MDKVEKLYNDLARYHQLNKEKSKSYIIHKTFRKGSEFNEVNDFIAAKINFDASDKLLDAGCGTGASSFFLAQKFNLKAHGISLSSEEINFANALSDKENLQHLVTFAVASFIEQLNQNFSKIIAIESIKHTNDLNLSLQNLCNNLEEKGLFILVEDLPIDKANLPYKELFKLYWSLSNLYDHSDFANSFAQSNMELVKEYDLSSMVKKHSASWLNFKIVLFSMLKKLAFNTKLKSILGIFIGGFILDYYYSKNLMQYKVLVWAKK